MAHSITGDFEAAVATSANAARANPRFSVADVLHAAALFRLGRLNEAKAAASRVLESEPHFTVSAFVRSHSGRADIWEPIGEALRQVGLRNRLRNLASAPHRFAGADEEAQSRVSSPPLND